jgi:hypothetical protein
LFVVNTTFLYAKDYNQRKYYYDFPKIDLAKLYKEEEESYFRRFEVSFFLALPFTVLISLVPFYIYESINQDRKDPYFNVYERAIIYTMSIGGAFYVGYRGVVLLKMEREKEREIKIYIKKRF